MTIPSQALHPGVSRHPELKIAPISRYLEYFIFNQETFFQDSALPQFSEIWRMKGYLI
jgi:hypothetical protein